MEHLKFKRENMYMR